MAKKRMPVKSAPAGVSESKFDFLLGVVLLVLGGLMTLQNMGLMPYALKPWPIIVALAGFGFIFKGAFEK